MKVNLRFSKLKLHDWLVYFPHVITALIILISTKDVWFFFFALIYSLFAIVILTAILLPWFLIEKFLVKKTSRMLVLTARYYLVILTSIAIAMLIGMAQGQKYDRVDAPYNRQVAHQTVDALEKFKTEMGQYPVKLEELVPSYMSEVPRTKKKQLFRYSRMSGGEPQSWFYLSYPDNGTGECYSSDERYPEARKWTTCGIGL
jgi:hypothetical protein